MKKKLILVFALLCIVSCNAYAFNLGSVAKNTDTNISSGGSGIFELLFWTNENRTIEIKFNVVSNPGHWTIETVPEKIFISRDSGDELIILPGMSQPATASMVRIISTPDYYSGEKHEIKIACVASIGDSASGPEQERFFTFYANVEEKQMDYNAFIIIAGIIILAMIYFWL